MAVFQQRRGWPNASPRHHPAPPRSSRARISRRLSPTGSHAPPSDFSSSIARIDAAPSIRSVERTIASTDSLGRVFNGAPFIGRPFLGARHRGKEASGA